MNEQEQPKCYYCGYEYIEEELVSGDTCPNCHHWVYDLGYWDIDLRTREEKQHDHLLSD